jgi:DNA mismatch repair protein MutS
VQNFHTEVRETADQVAFTYRVVPGSADRSYGVHVARLAGLPPSVTIRAAEELERLERGRDAPPPRHEIAEPGEPTAPPFLRTLVDLDPNSMTPLEALNALHEIREEARRWLEGGRRGPRTAPQE